MSSLSIDITDCCIELHFPVDINFFISNSKRDNPLKLSMYLTKVICKVKTNICFQGHIFILLKHVAQCVRVFMKLFCRHLDMFHTPFRSANCCSIQIRCRAALALPYLHFDCCCCCQWQHLRWLIHKNTHLFVHII